MIHQGKLLKVGILFSDDYYTLVHNYGFENNETLKTKLKPTNLTKKNQSNTVTTFARSV